jgi:hypothetical protein
MMANFGEFNETLTVSFKKTLMTAPYEPESVQADAEVKFTGNMTAIEREVITNVLLNTTEYTVICHLFKKKMITESDFIHRRSLLEDSTEAMMKKYEKLTGKDRYELINRVNTAEKDVNLSEEKADKADKAEGQAEG